MQAKSLKSGAGATRPNRLAKFLNTQGGKAGMLYGCCAMFMSVRTFGPAIADDLDSVAEAAMSHLIFCFALSSAMILVGRKLYQQAVKPPEPDQDQQATQQ